MRTPPDHPLTQPPEEGAPKLRYMSLDDDKTQIPPSVEEYFDVSKFQQIADINNNKTAIEENVKHETEIAFLPKILDSRHKHYISLESLQIENDLKMTKTIFEDFSEDIIATKEITNLKETSEKNVKDKIDHGRFTEDNIKKLSDLNMTDLAKYFIEDENYDEVISNEGLHKITNSNTTELNKNIINNESFEDKFFNKVFKEITDPYVTDLDVKNKSKNHGFTHDYDNRKEITDLNMTNSDHVMVSNIGGEDENIFFNEKHTEIFALNETSESQENDTEDITNTETDEDDKVTITVLQVDPLMDELEDMEEVERYSRASSVPSSFTYAHPKYMIGNIASIEQNNAFRRGMLVKQRLPVKGRVKIDRKFTNGQWIMSPAIESTDGTKIKYDDNIVMEAPLHGKGTAQQVGAKADDSKRVAALNRNIPKVDKVLFGEVPASGRFTVAATFC